MDSPGVYAEPRVRSRGSGSSASPPQGPQQVRSRAGSAGSFHLMEVGKNGKSNQGSPDLAMKPPPETAGPWSLDHWHKGNRQSWAEQMESEESPAAAPVSKGDMDEQFDPEYFLGEWLDNLGHKIVVSHASQRFRNQRPGRNQPRMSFRANLQKDGVPDKRFTITLDRWQQWRCGNGTLVQEESNQEFLTWEAEDGRVSNWERPVPEGPVYFDPPPEWNENDWGNAMPDGGYGQWVAIDVTELPQDWNFNGLNATFNPQAPEFVPSNASTSCERIPRKAYASPKGTPILSPAVGPGWGRTPTPSPMIRPCGSPLLQGLPDLGDAVPDFSNFTLPAAIELQLVEEGSDALVSGSRFDWTVADPWRELCKFPKDSCVMSPTFSIQEGHMQLSFYPNGSREAEPGHCSVALSRGPDSPGIKFEFSVNGRSTGPKVCLGRRYLGPDTWNFSYSSQGFQHVSAKILFNT
ncbi:unnamed protein product [Cladocopium goreaui]|uniref:SPRY domain-containing protein n=1 Tax=Cladocopium goreaui TaxID=2562237 RepID=A0A9P1BXB2_9DINO|nr:unnamed protein product [Cladocopium goreaui]